MTLLSAMPLLGEVAAAPTSVLFPLASYWWVYALFTAFVVVVLVVDLGVFHRVPHVMKFREAAALTRDIKDIAFSGDGEPTMVPNFSACA